MNNQGNHSAVELKQPMVGPFEELQIRSTRKKIVYSHKGLSPQKISANYSKSKKVGKNETRNND